MSTGEFYIAAAFAVATAVFFYQWYTKIYHCITEQQRKAIPVALGLLPLAAFVIILRALAFASFDVLGLWVLFYLIFGFAWLYAGLQLMFIFFDLSWLDDALGRNNPAAAIAVIGGGLGLTLTFAGANIGDGPGWWCVLLAGGLGLVAWLLLGLIADRVTSAFHRITVDWDIACAVRTGCYLTASGLILGRACAGDWTSFPQTVAEFADGWPVLALTAIFILIELIFRLIQNRAPVHEREPAPGRKYVSLTVSIILGIAFVAASIVAVYLLPPLPQNPEYDLPPQYDSMEEAAEAARERRVDQIIDDYYARQENGGKEKEEPPSVNLEISAEEALDILQQSRYSDMEKVMLPLTDEDRARYKELLGYDAPGWYYQNKTGMLIYDGFHGEPGQMQHSIMYQPFDIKDTPMESGSNTFYRVDSATGEIN